MIPRTIRWPLLAAWVVILGIVAYLATHPSTVAPLVSRLVSRNVFHDLDGSFRVRDFRLHLLRGVDLYDVSVTVKGERGGLTLISVDTLTLAYRLGELLGSPTHLRQVTASGGEVYALQGRASQSPGPPRLNLPQLRIDRLEIARTSLEISDPDGRLRQRIPELSWRGSVRADSLLRLGCTGADIDWETHASRISGLQGGMLIGPSGVSCNDLQLQLNASEVHLNGQRLWNGTLGLSVRAQAVSSEEVENLLDMDLGFRARGDLQASFSSRGDSLIYAGLFSGDLEGYQLTEMSGRAVILPGVVQWEELTGRLNGTFFSGEGRFDTDDPASVSFLLAGRVQDVDLSRGLVPDTELPASDGHGWVAIRHSDDPLSTQVQGVLREGHLASLPFDSVLVAVRVDSGGVNFERMAWYDSGQMAVLTGHTDPDRFFRGRVTLSAPDLARLPPERGLPRLSGSVTGSGVLQGQDDQLSLNGELALRRFELSPLRVDSGTVAVAVDDVLGGARAVLGARGDGLSVGGVPLGAFLFRGRASPRSAALEFFRSERGDTVVALRGRADFRPGRIDMQVGDLQMNWEGNQWQLSDSVAFTIGQEGISLPACRLASEHGELSIEGFYRPADAVSGSLELRRFDLGLLHPFLPPDFHLGGEATASVQISGHPDWPELSLDASVTGCRLEPLQIDSLRLAAGYARGRVTVQRLQMLSNYGRLRLAGDISHPDVGLRRFWPDAELALNLTMTDGDWAAIDRLQLPALDRIAGRFTSHLSVTGTTTTPIVVGDLTSRPFHIHWLHLEELSGRLRLDNTKLTLADLVASQRQLRATGHIEVPVTFDLLSLPETPLDGPFLMQVEIPPESDLAPLVQATNAFIEAGGRGGGQVTIAGPLEHPLYDGDLELRKANFVLKGLGEIYRDIAVVGSWSGDVLNLQRIRGKEGEKGKFTGQGEVVFSGLKLETFDVDLEIDRFLIASIPDLRVLVRSPRAHLSGVKVGPDSLIVPMFSGRLEVIEGRYTGDFAEKPSISDPRVATVAPDWLADLRLVAPPRSVRIMNRAMELRLSGDVDLIRDQAGLNLRGAMDIDSGRLPVFNNDFKVTRGRLDFSQEVGFDPQVDMEAETQVRIRRVNFGGSDLERITVHVTGSLYEPEIRFSSESGYPREGIERMLLGLSPHAGEPQTTAGLRGASIAAGFNLLEREIAAGLNVIDTFDIDQIDRQQEDGTTGVTPLVGVGKYLGQDLYIKYAQGLSESEDRDLLIEYQISDHLLLQSEIRRRIDELQGNLTYSLDIKYRFEY